MKNKTMLFLILISLSAVNLVSQDLGLTFKAKTGDAELDLTLASLNIEAKVDLSSFKAELSISYDIPQAEIEYMLDVLEMEPADIFMTAEISTITNEPIEVVIDVYQANKEQGWGAVARELGIKPGSEGFKSLKNDSSNKLSKIKGKKGKKK